MSLRRFFLLGVAFLPWYANAGAMSAQDERPILRLATLNAAHGRGSAPAQLGHDRATFEASIDAIATAVRVHQPDVLALQEADGPSAWSGGFDHVQRLAERCGLTHVHHGLHFDAGVGQSFRIGYGTALLSRFPLRNIASHPFRNGPLHRKGFVVAEIQFSGAPLRIVSLHFHSGARAVRMRQAQELIDHLNNNDDGESIGLVVMGDFNATWTSDGDAVRLVAEKLALQACRPDDESLRTFRSAAPTERLDWILISKDLSFVSCGNWTERLSDHLAAEAVIRRKK